MAFTSRELQAGFLIGECRIEPLENRIERGATRVHVEPRVMDVLVCLAERAGEVVSRDTLNQRVWANIVVTDQAVTNCISELRHHLGDDRSTNRIIETIPKRGYRLVAPVRLVSSPQEPLEPPAMSMASRERYLAAGVVLFGLVVAGLAWWLGRASPVPAATSVAVLRFENAAG
ncbi:MAG TPA: transcriptional regulator, partial [Steroidobacteraceae bacterium]|nr:transcriptional regulator [Steroidobacteraceae bacterium]